MREVKVKRLVLYTVSFILGRGTLFIAPLILANFLDVTAYGTLETALAAATIWSSTASLGTNSAIPIVLLRANTSATIIGIIIHQLLVVSVATSFFIVATILQWPLVWRLTALLTCCLVMQSYISTYLKSLGQSESSVLIDAGLLGLMAIAALGASYQTEFQSINLAAGAAIVYALTLMIINIRTLTRENKPKNRWAWIESIKTGIPLMLGGMLSILATTSGRLGMGLLASHELAASYSILARVGGLPIIAHQLILVAKFRNLFEKPDLEVEHAVQQVITLVVACVISFFLLSPWLGSIFGHAFKDSFHKYNLAGLLIVTQAILWSAIAVNDLIMTRNQVMHKVLPYSATYLVLALGAAWFILNWKGISLQRFVIVHAFVMFSFYTVQSWIMNLTGLKILRIWALASICYLTLVFIAFFAYNNL